MSGLFRKVLSFGFAVLFTLAAAEAHAADYLFRLTAQEIDETMEHYYPRGYDRELVHRQMSAPFDCRNFGDLCDEVGDEYAYQLVEGVWAHATKRYAIETIDRTTQRELENFARLWVDRLYPDGIGDKEPFWGVPAALEICDPTVSATSGDFRVRHTSRRFSVGVLAFGRVKVEHFKKNFWGNFRGERADLEVEGTVFVEFEGFEPVEFQIGDAKDDVKSVAATHGSGGMIVVSYPYVEGCGGVQNNGALRACSCSGFEPF